LLHGCNEIHRKCEKPVENLALKSRKLASNKGNKHFAQFLSTWQSKVFQSVTKLFRFLLIFQIRAKQISTRKNILQKNN
jgi:hypothetical protein